ncbi:MAG: N-acetylmuramoyl-L-alanine amidase [Calditrichaeota bacterium]|nr:N-acetylmuramoyl-L-alanine amidase [Calditrichota bacterium]
MSFYRGKNSISGRRTIRERGGTFIPHLVLILSLFIFALPPLLTAGEITIINKRNSERLGTIRALQAGRYQFVSVASLADMLSISYSKNNKNKQITLEIPHNPITITAISPFIKVGYQIRQIPIDVLYRNGIFYVPIKLFLTALRDVLPFQFEYDASNLELIVKSSLENITGVSIDEKANGILIHIATTEKFSRSDIFTSQRNNWFYIDIYGGRVDTLKSFPVKSRSKKILNVAPIQLSSETARISFHSFINFKEPDIIVNNTDHEVIVSLRTRESISNDLLAELQKEREKWKIDVVVIDPGHGGKDPGAIGRNGLYEKNVTLAIAKKIKSELQRRLDVKVVMTRKRDTFVPLKRRTEIANKAGGKLFISIHIDSNPSRRLHGHTVYFLGQAKTEESRNVAQFENSVIKFEDSQNHYAGLSDASFILAANAQNSYNKESQDFAAIVDNELYKDIKDRSHGVRQAGFYVLYGASMPNILLETAFISNRNDEKKLKNKSFYGSVAKAICDAVIKFKQRYEAEVQ